MFDPAPVFDVDASTVPSTAGFACFWAFAAERRRVRDWPRPGMFVRTLLFKGRLLVTGRAAEERSLW